MNNSNKFTPILIDAHVHIYPCFDVGRLLTSAYQNFAKHAKSNGLNQPFVGVLLLTETKNENWFEDHYPPVDQTVSIPDGESSWTLSQSGQGFNAMLAENDSGEKLFIVAGRQIVAKEGIEVSALFTRAPIKHRLPVDEVIRQIQANNGLVCLPWGVGKWLGKRGQLISRLIKENSARGVLVGDNSGRPTLWGPIAHFEEADQLGVNLLSGTDPLPLRNEEKRVGNFGSVFKESTLESPSIEDIRSLLDQSRAKFQPYGDLERPIKFFINQLKIRM